MDAGNECGVTVEEFSEWRQGDHLQVGPRLTPLTPMLLLHDARSGQNVQFSCFGLAAWTFHGSPGCQACVLAVQSPWGTVDDTTDMCPRGGGGEVQQTCCS